MKWLTGTSVNEAVATTKLLRGPRKRRRTTAQGLDTAVFVAHAVPHSSWEYRATAFVNCVAPIFIHFALLQRNSESTPESSSELSGDFSLNLVASTSHSLLHASISFQRSESNTP